MKEKLYNTLPFLILIIGLAATFFLWRSSVNINETQKQETLYSIERQIASAIKERLGNYADAHYAAAGLFLSSKEVSRKDWREFVESINLLNRYPGINGLGFALQVEKKDTLKFLEETRRDNSQNFKITRLGKVQDAEDLFIVKFIEPTEKNLAAVGFDMGSEPKRRYAMELARDSGITVISQKISLVQDSAINPGFLMYVPFYENGDIPSTVAKRRKKFKGWIYAPFIADNLLQRLFNRSLSELKDLVNIQIYDGKQIDPENLLFQSKNFITGLKSEKKQKGNVEKIIMPVYNNDWTIIIQPTKKFMAQYSSNNPWMIFVSGVLLSFSLFYIAHLLARTRRQAMALAEEMTIALKNKNKELQEKNIELERSNHDLEQFAYVASHDLKEPLRMVSSYTQLLAKKYNNLLDDDGKTYIAYASEGAERMGNLINDLLFYARISYKGKNLELVNINDVLKDVIKNNEIQLEETDTQIIYDSLPVILSTYNHLYSLFQNLISNAIKFRKADATPIIRINSILKDDFWQFSVEDNGIGIEPKYIEKIFVIFQRLHTRDKFSGTGIGLAICKKIVEFYGGKIWVESIPGQGSVFYFTLPATADKENMQQKIQQQP